MILSIDLNSSNKEIENNNKYSIGYGTDNKVLFFISLNSKDKIESIFSDVKKINSDIKEEMEYELGDTNFIELSNKFLNKDSEFFENLIKNTDDIILKGNFIDIKEFIENNPIIQNKNIIVRNQFNFDDDDYFIIKNYLSKYNINYNIEGNRETIKFKELDSTYNIINDIVKKVKHLDLSPAEQLMYVYDLIRDRVYTKEEKFEEQKVSRDLTNVLLGKKIVCAGYANIFNTVVTKLGYNSMVYTILNKNKKESGHARNMLYVKDDKYDIDGIYFFDTTWDSKRSEDNNNYLYSYRFFLKTRDQIEEYDEKFKRYDFAYFDEDNIYEVLDHIEDKEYSKIKRKVVDSINDLSRFIDGKALITPLALLPNLPESIDPKIDWDYVYDRLQEFLDMLNRPINADTYIKILYEVRKKEYYLDSDKYPFSLDSIFNAVINSNWLFDNPESNLLEAILGTRTSSYTTKGSTLKSFKEYNKENELDKKIEQVKLCKVLRKMYEKNK